MKIFDPKLTGSIEIQNTITGDVTLSGNLIVDGNLQGAVTASATASYVDFDNIDSKPTLLSGSAQIASDISGSFTSLSSSVASELLKNTTDTLTGDLTVTGTLTAQEFHTEFTSASVIYESGSTQFGNSSDDTHVFRGELFVSASDVEDILTSKNYSATGAPDQLKIQHSSGDVIIKNARGNVTLAGVGLALSGSDVTLYDKIVDDQFSSSFLTFNSSGNSILSSNDDTILGYLQNTYIKQSGNVGIKTSSAGRTLVVNGDFQARGLWTNTSSQTFWGNAEAGTSYGFLTWDSGYATVSANTGLDLRLGAGSTDHVYLKDGGTLGVGVSGPSSGVRLQATGKTSSGGANAIAPAGTAVSSSVALFTNGDPDYGTLFGTLNTGHGWIQQQRVDGTATAYNLLLQPNGGKVGIGTNSIGGSGGALTIVGSSHSSALDLNNTSSGGQIFRLVAINGGGFSIENISTSDTNVLRVDANSNIGIGTSGPGYKLHVDRGSSGVVLNLNGTNAYNAETGIYFSETRAKISSFLNGSGGTPGTSLRFYTMPDGGSVTERLRIDSSGNIVISQSSSTGVANSIAHYTNNFMYIRGGTAGLAVGDDGMATSMYMYDNSILTFNTAGSEAMRIDSSGRVGIGTTPQTWGAFTPLQVEDASLASTGGDLNLMNNVYYDGTNYKYIASQAGARQYFNTDGTITFHNVASGTAGSNLTWNERLRIDSSGNVGINESNAESLLHLKGLTNQVGITLENPQARKYQLFSNGSTGGGGASSGFFAIYDATAASDVFVIDSNGEVGIGTTNPATPLHIYSSTGTQLRLQNTVNSLYSEIHLQSQDGSGYIWRAASGYNGSQGGANALNIYNTGGGMVSIGTNTGTNTLNVNGGSVGIGTTSPQAKLDIVKAGNSAGGNIMLSGNKSDDTAKYGSLSFAQYDSGGEPEGFTGILAYSGQNENTVSIGGGIYEQNAATQIDFYTYTSTTKPYGNSGNLVMRIDSGTNVGIGTTAPSEKLHILGGKVRLHHQANGYGWIYAEDVNHSLIMRANRAGTVGNYTHYHQYGGDYSAGGGHHFWTGGALASQSLRFSISNDYSIFQNTSVGIGTTVPDEKLHVNGNVAAINSSYPTIKVQGSDVNYQARMRWDTNNNVLEFLTRHAGTYYSDTLVLKQGDVGIGTNAPDAQLDIYDSSRYGAALSIPIPTGNGSTADTDYSFSGNYNQTRHHFRGSHEILLGRFTLRDGSRYLDIKTNINSNSYMFGARAIGYLYGRDIIDSQVGGYAYTSNSVINKFQYESANTGRTIDAYRASGGELCFRVDSGSNGYSEGQVYIYFYGHGNSNGVQVNNYIQNDSSTNYYA